MGIRGSAGSECNQQRIREPGANQTRKPCNALHLSPVGRGRLASGSFSERSKSGEGEPLYRESFPPHPNPLPAGERERAEFSATSVSQSSPATASGNAFPRGVEAYPSGERGDVPIEPVTSPAR